MSADVVVDLFAGPGGWDVAARELGLDPIGVEWDFDACQTARAAGHRRVPADIAHLDPAQFVTEHANGADVTGLIASPPCQAFSVAGRGRGRAGASVILDGVARIAAGDDPRTVCKAVDAALDDDRAALVLEPLRWALDLEPQWLAFEQVPPVLPLWEAFAEVLRADGYNVDTGWLTAEQFDVPQTRKRAFLVAHRDLDAHLPTPVRRKYRKGVAQHEGDPALLPWVSMADALGWGGAAIRSNYGTGGDASNRGERTSEEPAATVTSHVDRNLWQYVNGTHAHAARREVDAPAPTVMFGARANSVTWQRDDVVLDNDSNPERTRPRPVDEPAPTIKCSRPGNLTWQPRLLSDNRSASRAQRRADSVRVTVAEAAALQGFPVGYPWQGTRTAQYRQVGDAVPPPLAWHVLRAATGGAA